MNFIVTQAKLSESLESEKILEKKTIKKQYD